MIITVDVTKVSSELALADTYTLFCNLRRDFTPEILRTFVNSSEPLPDHITQFMPKDYYEKNIRYYYEKQVDYYSKTLTNYQV
jgi:hypothetical protein